MASRRVARVGLATTKVGEGAGAAVVGERRREKRRQESRRNTVWNYININLRQTTSSATVI